MLPPCCSIQVTCLDMEVDDDLGDTGHAFKRSAFLLQALLASPSMTPMEALDLEEDLIELLPALSTIFNYDCSFHQHNRSQENNLLGLEVCLLLAVNGK